MNPLVRILWTQIPGSIGVAALADGTFRVDLGDGSSRIATGAEILSATKESKIAAINAECRSRLIARYGPPEEQVSRALGVYGQTERDAMEAGIAATIDASNTASNAVIAAADQAAVEAVTVTWPVI